MFTVFYFTLFYTDEGTVICRQWSSITEQERVLPFGESCCPSLVATSAPRSAVERHWHDGVLMVRGQDRGVNAATLCIQIYDILCERVTELSLLLSVVIVAVWPCTC